MLQQILPKDLLLHEPQSAGSPEVKRLSDIYTEAMKSYVPPPVYSADTSSNASKKRKKDPNAPKKPATA